MDDVRFDALVRRLGATPLTRALALRGLTGGVLAGVLGSAIAVSSTDAKKKRKTCPSGFTRCTVKRGRKKRKKSVCVDTRNDSANCGGCGQTCATGQVCQGSACTCNGAPCAGCCADNVCQAGTTTQQCGTNGAVCQTCDGGRSCQNGSCGCPSGQDFCGGACVDTETDAANCGSCGNVCSGGNDCNTVVCNQGSCETTPNDGAPCANGTGSCDAAGHCIATVCAGKASANPCFERDGAFCNAAQTCNCGTGIHGTVACFENAYCNHSNPNGGPECASNADCVAMGYPQGSICFLATNCCISQTGCTTPCPS